MSNRYAGFWTINRIDVLETCWKAGESAATIATVLACSRCAVIGKLNRLGFIDKMKGPERSRRLSAALKRSWAAGRRNRRHFAEHKRKISISLTRQIKEPREEVEAR